MNAPVTLLYVITGTGIGGAEKALCELVERIDRNRYRVVVCSLKRSGAYGARLAGAANAFYDLGLSKSAGLRAVLNFIPATLRLAMIMRRERPRIVHCFLFRASMMGRLAACLCPKTAVIASVRVMEQGLLKYAFERLTRALVHCYTAVSDEVRLAMIERAHVAPTDIITIYNGIDCTGFALPARGPEGIRAEKRIALIGRLHAQKGHRILLEALKTLITTGRHVHLYLAGEGPDEAALRQRVRNMGISGAVTFSGVVDDVVAFINDIDIVVLPSLWEGMPNVLLEAMCAGRPIVATRLGGIEELVEDNVSALLCEPGRARPLADAIAHLLDDPDLAGRLASAARQDAHKRFDITHTVAATRALYEDILRERQPESGGQ